VAPLASASVISGAMVLLSGVAEDLEDGYLPESAFAWSSDRDGALGTGRALTLSTLSMGAHVLTLRVTDSDGQSTTSTVSLNVEAAAHNTRLRADRSTDRTLISG